MTPSSPWLPLPPPRQIPVFLGLDCENWWSGSGLSNWYNPAAPHYNASNRDNVEAVGWGGSAERLKISWRDWGSQIRVAPAPNLFAERPMAMCKVRVGNMSG